MQVVNSILNFKNNENTIQSIQANIIKANYIITRNIKGYKKSKVTATKSSKLIEIV